LRKVIGRWLIGALTSTLAIVLTSAILVSCTNSVGSQQASSSACQKPPESFIWGKKTYTLNTVGNRELEPGTKLGYLDCNEGTFTQGVSENAAVNIYTYGSPLASDDLLFFGVWGRALYSPADNNPSVKIKINEPVQITEESSPVIEPETREFRLSPELEQELQKKKRPMQGLFETTMETIKADGKINIHFSIRNISGNDLRITYGSGQQYDVWVYNENDEEVYRWSLNKAFTEALIVREFDNSEAIEFDEAWNLQDNEGDPVPSGPYSIVIRIMIGLDEGTISQEELTATAVVEI